MRRSVILIFIYSSVSLLLNITLLFLNIEVFFEVVSDGHCNVSVPLTVTLKIPVSTVTEVTVKDISISEMPHPHPVDATMFITAYNIKEIANCVDPEPGEGMQNH